MTDMKKKNTRKQQKGGAYPIIPSPVMPAYMPSSVVVGPPRVASPAFMGPTTPPTMLRYPTQSTLVPVLPPTVHYMGGRRIMAPVFTIPPTPFKDIFFVRRISRNDPYFILVVRYKFQGVTDKCYAFFKLDSRAPTFTAFQCGGRACAIQNNNTSSMTEDNKRAEVQNFFNATISGKVEPLPSPPELMKWQVMDMLGRSFTQDKMWNTHIYIGEVDLSTKPRPPNTAEVLYLTQKELEGPEGAAVASHTKTLVLNLMKQKP